MVHVVKKNGAIGQNGYEVDLSANEYGETFSIRGLKMSQGIDLCCLHSNYSTASGPSCIGILDDDAGISLFSVYVQAANGSGQLLTLCA